MTAPATTWLMRGERLMNRLVTMDTRRIVNGQSIMRRHTTPLIMKDDPVTITPTRKGERLISRLVTAEMWR